MTSRPASLGLLLVSLRNVNNQLTRSQAALADHKERLTSLHSLPVTELVRLAEVNPEVKLATVVVRRMAQDKVTSIISSKTLEVSLCSASLEGLIFLIWRHLEHFLLYSGAALAAGQHTPIQEAYSKHTSFSQEPGYSSAQSRPGFASVSSSRNKIFNNLHQLQDDIEKLKKDILTVMNETFFDKLGDNVATVESVVQSKAAAQGFLQATIRRTKRLSSLHTQ